MCIRDRLILTAPVYVFVPDNVNAPPLTVKSPDPEIVLDIVCVALEPYSNVPLLITFAE